MDGFVDLHSHLLPGIDDGPREMRESLAMLRAAADAGTATIAATPHVDPGFPDVHVEQLATRAQALREAADKQEIEIRLAQGAEVSLVWALDASAEELKLATYEQRGSDVLVETPAIDVFGLDELLYQLRVKGLRITLAHPERSSEFQRDPDRLASLVDQGVLLQINAPALMSDRRKSGAARLARQLVIDGLAHIVASDGHRAAAWRPVTTLPAAVPTVEQLVGPERARWLTIDAPGAILAGTELPPPPAIAPRQQRRWPPWSR